MPSQKNIDNLEKINQKKSDSKSVVFAHYQGLTVNQINELRDKIRKAGGEMAVFKNTLLRLVFGKDKELDETLSGPTATIFAYDDEIAPIKAMAEFHKENELPTFTAGYFDEKIISADEVNQLSKLPSKQELQAKVVGSLAAPLSGMVNVLQSNLRNLVYALKAIQDKKA